MSESRPLAIGEYYFDAEKIAGRWYYFALGFNWKRPPIMSRESWPTRARALTAAYLDFCIPWCA